MDQLIFLETKENSQMENLKKELKKLGKEIAKYSNDKFASNCISSKYMRLSYYLSAKEPTLQKWIDSKKALKKLEAGENVVWLGMV